MIKLPDFDTMMRLHKDAPVALKRLHQGLFSEQVINALKDTKRRLQGLQLRIFIELRRAGNPTARILKITGMTQESFTELNYCLNSPLKAIAEKHRSQNFLENLLNLPNLPNRASIDLTYQR